MLSVAQDGRLGGSRFLALQLHSAIVNIAGSTPLVLETSSPKLLYEHPLGVTSKPGWFFFATCL